MDIKKMFEEVPKEAITTNALIELQIGDSFKVKAYPFSIIELKSAYFFVGLENLEKYLFIVESKEKKSLMNGYEGTEIEIGGNLILKKCDLTAKNRKELQKHFSFTIPQILGLNNSYGLGDRIGLANAGHIRAIKNSNFKPILAQQSIRELMRTNRTPDDVMDAAVWAVFQEGYKEGFGSDADHLKTTEDIDLMLGAGFTMFTFDPSEHVDNNADNYDEKTLLQKVKALNWNELYDKFESAEKRYAGNTIKISELLTLNVSETDFLRAYAKYGRAVAHIKKLSEHLKSKCSDDKFEIEVSVDETESVTSPFEHYFFANELTRLNVKYISLAPRFIGDFEKGIDYKGDLNLFKTEYEKHLAITKHFGNYKISLHSGSDKFSVYKVIGSLREAYTHVKTAGTSYLEALRVVAAKEPNFFKEIYDFCYSLYEKEKKSYHVSADIKILKTSDKYSNEELLQLFSSNDARQVLHVTFGRVLTEKKENGEFLFKNRILECLKKYEDTHYEFLINHFNKHLEPFK